MIDISRCKAKVFPRDMWGAFYPHKCSRRVWKDGYCKTHHPDIVKERREKADKRFREKMDNSPLSKAMRRIKELEIENENLKKQIKKDNRRK